MKGMEISMDEWRDDERKRSGTICRDVYSKGVRDGKQRKYDCWRAEITVHGRRYTYRNKSRDACRDWLNAVLAKRIHPSDNGADWLRAEQCHNMAARYEEMQAIDCEEGALLYGYMTTRDMGPLREYIEKSLLPHLVYYSCHTLKLGRKSAILYSREAVALLLTKISAGRPVISATALCKRVIRTKRNGNTFYYDHMPRDMRMVVDGVDYAPLEQLWKVTKDKRI